LIIDIKIADADQNCAEIFETDKEDVTELFPNVWQGERLVYLPANDTDEDGIGTYEDVSYSECTPYELKEDLEKGF
jgi:hypothetical protein